MCHFLGKVSIAYLLQDLASFIYAINKHNYVLTKLIACPNTFSRKTVKVSLVSSSLRLFLTAAHHHNSKVWLELSTRMKHDSMFKV